MTIRISRNEAGNCINFIGSNKPAYWNACLSAQINVDDAGKIDVVNDIRTDDPANPHFEFFGVDFLEFADVDGAEFTDAQAAVDYINTNGNVQGLSSTGTNLIGVDIDFFLDETNTTVLTDKGYNWAVNSLKAIAQADGTIHLYAIASGNPETGEASDREYLRGIETGRVSVNGAVVSGGISDIVNTLNELFTVGAFTSIVITDPFSTMVADVDGVDATMSIEGTYGIDPIGDDVFAASASGALNGYKSSETINQPGEYFTFDIRNEAIIGFGLIISDQNWTDGLYPAGSNTNSLNPAKFGTSNSSHGGFQFSHWFHPTPDGSWTNYGALTGYIRGPAWYRANIEFEGRDEWLAGNPIKIKVGIDENGFIAISSLADDGVTWKLHARTNYPAPEGAEYHLGIKMGDTTARVYSLPKVHELEETAPTMYFRYIESPDGEFDYPLFVTAEEAEYYDQNHGGTTGTGTYTTVIYPDDPTNTLWYKPDTGFTDADSAAPTSSVTFEGTAINWTEVTSLTNADLVPTAFTDTVIEVDEGAPVNVSVTPAGAGWTTTITDVNGNGFTLDAGGHVQGTAPQVSGDTTTNPSDDWDVTVHRSNAYGSADGTLTIRVNNLTAPVVQAITGFTWEPTSTALIATDELDDGSVVHVDDTIASGRRMIITQAWIETNVLPNLTAANDFVVIGIANGSPSWGSVDISDFDAHIKLEWSSSSSHTSSIGHSGSNTNSVTVSSLTDAYYDYAFEVDGNDVHVIAYNANDINTQPAVNSGGTFGRVASTTITGAPHTVSIASVNTTMDVATSGLSEINIPVAASSSTTFSKALNFTGSNEHAKQSNSAYSISPLATVAGGATSTNTANPGFTSTAAYANPWAVACVFNRDNVGTQQHIWNQGEGAGNTDDNIYLRTDQWGALYFGWGRSGALNEYLISTSLGSAAWYGVYVGFDGTRLSGTNATAANLAQAFDIKLMFNQSGGWDFNPNPTSPPGAGTWTTTGGRMDRVITGDWTVGGRGGNRNFNGEVASCVVTTLKCGVAMPTNAEIEMMITDPVRWAADYKAGNTYRAPQNTGLSYNWQVGAMSPSYATQIWLMGDSASDSYPNIKNYVYTAGSNNDLVMQSMVSNDIENVTIAGL